MKSVSVCSLCLALAQKQRREGKQEQKQVFLRRLGQSESEDVTAVSFQVFLLAVSFLLGFLVSFWFSWFCSPLSCLLFTSAQLFFFLSFFLEVLSSNVKNIFDARFRESGETGQRKLRHCLESSKERFDQLFLCCSVLLAAFSVSSTHVLLLQLMEISMC